MQVLLYCHICAVTSINKPTYIHTMTTHQRMEYWITIYSVMKLLNNHELFVNLALLKFQDPKF